MVEFHKQLKNGKRVDKAAALQQAQKKIMETKGYKHPYYWAPFVLIGDCYSMKLDLLTNATVVDDAIRFVKESNGKLTMSKEEAGNKSQGSEYSEDTELDEETSEITTNQVF